MSDSPKFNTYSKRRPVVLIVPLDWGLGHVTRCIPIISYLLEVGCEVIAGAEVAQKALLLQEFPDLNIIDLSGYRMKYGYSSWHTRWRIMTQSAKILTKINKEKRWLDQLLENQHIDVIISDNRFGLHSSHVKSIFISHQLAIQTGLGSIADQLIQRFNYHFINKFSACWIPDEEGENNLAGALSHPKNLPAIPVKYIGLLSRFNSILPRTNFAAQRPNLNDKVKLLIILSGPEPQRSIFEKILLKELQQYHEPVDFVRGLPGEVDQIDAFNQVSVYNHLPAEILFQKIKCSHIIISRSGYSTVMDLLTQGKKCLFVATPGQSEQEYLAKYLMKKKLCIAIDQDKFSLKVAIEQAKSLNEPAKPYRINQFQSAIDDMLKQLR